MVSRRKFLGMLAVLPAITALAGSGLRLPQRREVEVEEVKYFASNTTWYIKTDLTEKSIEDALKQLTDAMRHEPYRLNPTKIFVPPRLAHTAHYVLTHKPTLFERFMWRLFPVD